MGPPSTRGEERYSMRKYSAVLNVVWKAATAVSLIIFCAVSLLWLPNEGRALTLVGLISGLFSLLAKRLSGRVRVFLAMLGAALIGCAAFYAGSACIQDPALCVGRRNPLQEYLFMGVSVASIVFLACLGSIFLDRIASHSQMSTHSRGRRRAR